MRKLIILAIAALLSAPAYAGMMDVGTRCWQSGSMTFCNDDDGNSIRCWESGGMTFCN